MANLDTENKRRAAQQFAPWTIMPVSDGVIAAEDREQASWIYSGIKAGAPAVTTNNLKIMSLKLNNQLSMSISYTGDCIPISLLSAAPSAAPSSGKGLVVYESGGTLKLAAWTGSAWITT